jgi:hypothetical protein
MGRLQTPGGIHASQASGLDQRDRAKGSNRQEKSWAVPQMVHPKIVMIDGSGDKTRRPAYAILSRPPM